MTAFEPGDELCPPYWPEILWWLVHHGPNPGPFDVSKVDETFAVLAIHALVAHVVDEKLAEGVRSAIAGHAALSFAS